MTSNKKSIIEKEIGKIEREFSQLDISIKKKVAFTCKILAEFGHESGLAGQITAKISDQRYVTQALGAGLAESNEKTLLEVDKELNVVDGNGIPSPANRFHISLYEARSDITCVVHTHPLYTSALSMLGSPLIISHMDTCILYDDVGFLKEWPGVPVGYDEGEVISAALGDKSAALLAHHGLVVVADSVERACILALQFERAAKLQIIASAAGAIQPIDAELALEAKIWTGNSSRIAASFNGLVTRFCSLD
ncbi:MAG: L-fuculose-phosphate aldolase [Arenicella sp.]|jgi:L-fuculose-phosphate aldolase